MTEISEAAELARQRLHEEIERLRLGVEEMLDEQDRGGASSDVRRELEELRVETRKYVKRKIRKSEKQLARSMRELDARSDRLERRIDEVEADREAAEVRIHNNTEQMLDGLLREVRTIADRIAGRPSPPQGPVGRIGPQPISRSRPGQQHH